MSPKQAAVADQPKAPRRTELREDLDMDLLISTLTAFRRGDFGVRLPATWAGPAGRVADTLNGIFENNERMHDELGRVKREVGKEGKLSRRVNLPDATGDWYELYSNMNELIDDLVR